MTWSTTPLKYGIKVKTYDTIIELYYAISTLNDDAIDVAKQMRNDMQAPIIVKRNESHLLIPRAYH